MRWPTSPAGREAHFQQAFVQAPLQLPLRHSFEFMHVWPFGFCATHVCMP